MKEYKSILGTRIEDITVSPNYISILTKLNRNNTLKLKVELGKILMNVRFRENKSIINYNNFRTYCKRNKHFIIIPINEFNKLVELGKVL